MKKNGILFLIGVVCFFFVVGCASPFSKSPGIKNVFLSFIPKNEPGAPHNLKWLILNDSGNLGYYNSNYFPGNLNVQPYNPKKLLHPKVDFIPKGIPSEKGYEVSWKLPYQSTGVFVDYDFWISSNGSTLFPMSSAAEDITFQLQG